MPVDPEVRDGCWNCCHWQQGTQDEGSRAHDRDSGYDAECSEIERGIRIRPGGDRRGWRGEASDELTTLPTFRCMFWSALRRAAGGEDGE